MVHMAYLGNNREAALVRLLLEHSFFRIVLGDVWTDCLLALSAKRACEARHANVAKQHVLECTSLPAISITSLESVKVCPSIAPIIR